MNKKMNELVNTVKTDATNETAKAELTDLATRKFKQVYAYVQAAARTVNRHVAPGKGHPNRAKLATAIGLMGEFAAYAEIGKMLGMPEMEAAANTLTETMTAVKKMRDMRTYDHVPYLPDYLTQKEQTEVDEYDAKMYLYNITQAVNEAAENIGKHIVAGDFDPNTYTVAKALGYADEIGQLMTDFANLAVATGNDYTAEQNQLKAIGNAIDKIAEAKDGGYNTAVTKVADYDPFPEPDDDDEDEGEGDDDDGEGDAE